MNNERKNIVSVITSPLGFFALSLLITEGFLGIVLILSKEPSTSFKFWGMLIGAFLFLVVVILVWVIVWKKPAHLTLEGRHHLEILQKMNSISLNKDLENLEKNANFKKYIEKIYD